MFKSSHTLAFSLGAGVTVLLMLFIGYQLDGDTGLCTLEAAGSPAETPATCLRSWLGALSGWVAAGAAIGVALPTLAWLRAQTQLPTVEAEITDLERLIENLRQADNPVGNIYNLMDSGKLHWSDIAAHANELSSSLELIKDAAAKSQALGLGGKAPEIQAAIKIASNLTINYGFLVHNQGDRLVQECGPQASVCLDIEKIRECLVKHRGEYVPILTAELARLREWRYGQAFPR